MTRRVIIALGILIAIPAALFLGLVLLLAGKQKPSNIIDFHPVSFTAHASEPFFYSVGNSLKYADVISKDERTLFVIKDRVKNPVVSPDGSMLAFADGGQLSIVNRWGSVIAVASVDSIYHGFDEGTRKPIGQVFFRDEDFQWTRDSRALYLIRDVFYDSKGSQLYSKYGELWKYDLRTRQLQLVLKPFEAYQFFFGKSGIYFSVPTPTGDLKLMYFNGNVMVDVVSPGDQLFEEALNQGKPDQIFYSFDTALNGNQPKNGKYISTQADETKGVQTWSIFGKPFLSISQGETIKGSIYCGSVGNTRYLPGENYALLDFRYCGKFNGELLVDLQNGDYTPAPIDTRVYLPLNTDNHKSFSISGGGITFR